MVVKTPVSSSGPHQISKPTSNKSHGGSEILLFVKEPIHQIFQKIAFQKFEVKDSNRKTYQDPMPTFEHFSDVPHDILIPNTLNA